jgi:hypothetical protein
MVIPLSARYGIANGCFYHDILAAFWMIRGSGATSNKRYRLNCDVAVD